MPPVEGILEEKVHHPLVVAPGYEILHLLRLVKGKGVKSFVIKFKVFLFFILIHMSVLRFMNGKGEDPQKVIEEWLVQLAYQCFESLGRKLINEDLFTIFIPYTIYPLQYFPIFCIPYKLFIFVI